MFNIEIPEGKFDLHIDVGLSMNAPHSINWLKTKPNCFIIGIEPNKKCISNIREKTNLFPELPFVKNYIPKEEKRFTVVNCGIGNVEIPITKKFHVMRPDPGTSSFLKPTNVLLSSGHTIESVESIPIISLKYLLDNLDWTKFNSKNIVLKSDTQGYELEILLSLGEYIYNIIELTIEMTTNGQYENATNHVEIIKFAQSNGLTLIGYDSEGNGCFRRI